MRFSLLFIASSVLAVSVLALSVSGCGSDFEVPAPPDARIDLDLAVSPFPPAPPDLNCFNTACGGCSAWANFDGTPAKVGDPCLYKGVYQCTGTSLVCSSTACLTCQSGGKTPVGSVCGADGHTIVELQYTGTTCAAYDFGSSINVCNHGSGESACRAAPGPTATTSITAPRTARATTVAAPAASTWRPKPASRSPAADSVTRISARAAAAGRAAVRGGWRRRDPNRPTSARPRRRRGARSRRRAARASAAR